MGLNQQMGGARPHARDESRSSGGSSGQQQRGGIGLGPSYASHLQGRGLGVRMGTGRESLEVHANKSCIVNDARRVRSSRNPVQCPSKPSPRPRWHTPKRIPQSRHRPFIPELTNDAAASWRWCCTKLGQLCAWRRRQDVKEVWRDPAQRTVGTIGDGRCIIEGISVWRSAHARKICKR
jgi:hypothetical protein